jgi:hypothetical protein
MLPKGKWSPQCKCKSSHVGPSANDDYVDPATIPSHPHFNNAHPWGQVYGNEADAYGYNLPGGLPFIEEYPEDASLANPDLDWPPESPQSVEPQDDDDDISAATKCKNSPGRQQPAALAAHCSLRCHLHRLQGHGRQSHKFSDAEEVADSTFVTAIILSTGLTFGKGKVVLSENSTAPATFSMRRRKQ